MEVFVGRLRVPSFRTKNIPIRPDPVPLSTLPTKCAGRERRSPSLPRKALTLGSTVLPCGKGSHPMDLDLANINMGKGRTQSEMSIRAGIIT